VPTQSFGELSTSVPLLGLVTAGLPADAEEQVLDTVNLDDMLIGKKELTYMLEVDGDSMIEAHIERGDMVLVEKTSVARGYGHSDCRNRWRVYYEVLSQRGKQGLFTTC
jgi:SOS-response transcriptional repressor LexA